MPRSSSPRCPCRRPRPERAPLPCRPAREDIDFVAGHDGRSVAEPDFDLPLLLQLGGPGFAGRDFESPRHRDWRRATATNSPRRGRAGCPHQAKADHDGNNPNDHEFSMGRMKSVRFPPGRWPNRPRRVREFWARRRRPSRRRGPRRFATTCSPRPSAPPYDAVGLGDRRSPSAAAIARSGG